MYRVSREKSAGRRERRKRREISPESREVEIIGMGGVVYRGRLLSRCRLPRVAHAQHRHDGVRLYVYVPVYVSFFARRVGGSRRERQGGIENSESAQPTSDRVST